MLKDRTLLYISCSICPTIYVNKHLSRLIYGRAPTKGSKPVVTRNRRISKRIRYLTKSKMLQMYNNCTLQVGHF